MQGLSHVLLNIFVMEIFHYCRVFYASSIRIQSSMPASMSFLNVIEDDLVGSGMTICIRSVFIRGLTFKGITGSIFSSIMLISSCDGSIVVLFLSPHSCADRGESYVDSFGPLTFGL